MIVSRGSLVSKTPMLGTGVHSFPHMPGMASAGMPGAYAALYRQQLWVKVVVSKRARGTARLPFPVYERQELGRRRVDDHQMARLLSKPNPKMQGYDLWLWTASTRDVFGRAHWFKIRGSMSGTPMHLAPLHPAAMTYNSETDRWSFDNGRMRLNEIDPADLVTFREYTPELGDAAAYGLSPLEPLRATLENEWNAREATSSFWQRGARPGMALTHPKTLSEKAIDRLSAQMDAMHGGSSNVGRTLIMEEGLKPERMDLSAEEAQYIETRKLNREEVCAGFDMPPPAVHILDHATFSNITEQLRSLYRDTMGGILPEYEAAVERDLRGIDFADDDIYAEFSLDEVLRGDFEKRAEALNKTEHMTLAEKRQADNLPFIDGTDRIFLNTATMPLDAIDAQAAALAATRSVVSPLEAQVVRSVLGRLSWQESLEDVDTDALVRGLDDEHASVVLRAYVQEAGSAGTVESLRDRIKNLTKG